ncbi:hypothetical protein, partial [Pseudomonas aeruginosa]|uniref:hypothetical protein n=1 Tax=Pseudomonas aeruginosa TaxID=287 RepID=UPI0031B69EE4
MQVSINKPWHRRCAAGINPLQSRSISVFCANTGNSLVQDIGSALANKPPASDAEIQLIRSRLVL